MTDKTNENPLKDVTGDDAEPQAEQTQNAADMPPTHFAIDVRTCADLRKLLGSGHDYDDVAVLIAGIERGVPLSLGTK